MAAPYARWLHGSTLTVGLLMAITMLLGMVIGAFLLGRVAAPSARIRMMGWLAVLSCAPLIGSARGPPLWAVLPLWVLAGGGGAVRPVRRPRARHPGRRRGEAGDRAPLAVGLAGLVGVTAATMLAMSWTHLRGRLIQAQRGEAETMGA